MLAGQDAHVIVSSRKLEGCQGVAADIEKASGSAEAFACHVGEMAQIEAVMQHVRNQHGRLDILGPVALSYGGRVRRRPWST